MSNQMTEEQAAAELSGKGAAPPSAIAAIAQLAERIEEEKGKIEEEGGFTPEDPARPPKRKFNWVNEDSLNIEEWLAGNACAVLQIVPGLTVQFQEAKESSRDDVDALVNGIGPDFIMKGLRDGVMATQIRRASNIGLLCQSITHMNGERWMPGSTLEGRWKELKGKGTIMIDRLTEALYEFSDQLLWKIENGDLGNS